jgi:hypothetical protein
MGWRGQHNQEDEEERWRWLPFRERYNWSMVRLTVGLAITVILFFILNRWL